MVGFVINVYVFLLLKYCGGVLIYYVIINGEKEVGVIIMEMVVKMDVGDMVLKVFVEIIDEDNVGIMFDRFVVVGCDFLLDMFLGYLLGDIKLIL